MTQQQITWDDAMAFSREIGQRRTAIFDRSWQLAQAQARVAHPETNGEDLLVHNWGNDQAKRAWARHRERTARAYRITEAAYSRVWAVARRSLRAA